MMLFQTKNSILKLLIDSVSTFNIYDSTFICTVYNIMFLPFSISCQKEMYQCKLCYCHVYCLMTLG